LLPFSPMSWAIVMVTRHLSVVESNARALVECD
jgi:hypothetical protein